MAFTGLASGTYDLDRLHDYLYALDRQDDVMLLEQLDGYLTAIALAPRMIVPSEWLSAIWDKQSPDFADQEEAQAIYRAIMGLYNDNLQALADPDAPFEPILTVDLDGSIMADYWAEGFAAGVAFRHEDWRPLIADGVLGGALAMIAAVSFAGAEDGTNPVHMPKKERERLYRDMPRLIPGIVKDIHAFWQKRGLAAGSAPVPPGPTIKSLWLMQNGLEAEDEPPVTPVRSVKVGRNEPCPCGSGKKYKRCCGA